MADSISALFLMGTGHRAARKNSQRNLKKLANNWLQILRSRHMAAEWNVVKIHST